MKTFRIIAAIFLVLFSILAFKLAIKHETIYIAAFGFLSLGQSIVMMPSKWGKKLKEFGKGASYAIKH